MYFDMDFFVYLVTLWGVVGVVQRELISPPLAVALSTQEGDPASGADVNKHYYGGYSKKLLSVYQNLTKTR